MPVESIVVLFVGLSLMTAMLGAAWWLWTDGGALALGLLPDPGGPPPAVPSATPKLGAPASPPPEPAESPAGEDLEATSIEAPPRPPVTLPTPPPPPAPVDEDEATVCEIRTIPDRLPPPPPPPSTRGFDRARTLFFTKTRRDLTRTQILPDDLSGRPDADVPEPMDERVQTTPVRRARDKSQDRT